MRIMAYSKRKRSRKSAKIRPIRVICDPIPPLKISRAETQGRRGFFIDGVELLFMSSPSQMFLLVSFKASYYNFLVSPIVTNPELMQIHVETLFTHDNNRRLLVVNEPNGRPAPRFFLGRTQQSTLYRFRHDLPQPLIHQLTKLAQNEPTGWPLIPEPKHTDEYKRLLQTHAPIQQIFSGLAYRVPIPQPSQPQTIQITRQNAHLLQDDFRWLCEEIELEQPCLAVVQNGRAVSICRSVRIGPQAHEAGVETLAAYRGNGFAPQVVAAWAAAVHQLGRIPLYSTSWDNLASQSVAQKSAAIPYGVTYHIT
jgi:RimJ/RimL family protein N-acetyltransferase